MIETALKIGPDFAADVGPAFAEGKILAEIDAGDLSAKAGRGHHKVNWVGHDRLRSGGRCLHFSPNSK
jgi:hypothetical protein